MRREVIIEGKTLGGVSDLTLQAPIRQGLCESLEAITYKSRVKALLRTLNTGRASALEYSLLRPFSDTVERVGVIHSVRLAMVGPDEDQLMLAVTFDGALEPYVRVLWQKVGTLLDMIFCNTEGYVTADGHSYDEWAGWVRRVRVETEYFYATPALTVGDMQYLSRAEALHRSATDTDAHAASLRVVGPEAEAWNLIFPGGASTPAGASVLELATQGLQALAVLYRLADYYRPGTPDGDCLQRAARGVLLEMELFGTHKLFPPGHPARVRFEKQLAWFENRSPNRVPPPRVVEPDDPADVQGGIVGEYIGVTHGCVLLLAFDGPKAAAAFLTGLPAHVTTHAAPTPAGQPIVNIAFTFEGLRQIGLAEEQLARFPPEFREGMEERASLLGDLYANHPRRWTLPRRNWPMPRAAPGAPPAAVDEHVELASVHALLQLRIDSPSGFHGSAADPAHPLHAKVTELLAIDAGVRVLSEQPLRRHFIPHSPTSREEPHGKAWEHFGFVDGLSQPEVAAAPTSVTAYDNTVPLGDLLLGYANRADHAPPRDDLLHNGSFMVVRKLRQHVDRFRAVTAGVPGLGPDVVGAKLVGRDANGVPLTAGPPPATPNDFDYQPLDQDGAACPFAAHTRRANPRGAGDFHAPSGGRGTPRIMRRGMSYGERFDDKPADDRGVFFIAYNASIAEQFEQIQRWMSGANSSGAGSAQSDPLLGVPRPGDARDFRFVDTNGGAEVVRRVQLCPARDGKPLAELQWGAYLFTPSLKAIRAMGAIASHASESAPWSAEEGRASIEALLALPAHTAEAAWKAALEDIDERRFFRAASIWAAIRELHGGVLRTPFGVLVASAAAVDQVFVDKEQRYTASGYMERMRRSFGPIHLGLDREPNRPGCPYHVQADATNAEIQKITAPQAFDRARFHANTKLDLMIGGAVAQAHALGLPAWELNLDLKEVIDEVLGGLCEDWFGLPGPGAHLKRGGWRWDWDPNTPPLYPGHFTAPSRYMFQPAPGTCPVEMGQTHGQALHRAVRDFIAAHSMPPTAPIAKAIFAAGAAIEQQLKPRPKDDWIASTFIGVMVGFLPSVDGNLRASLNEWLKDGSFWRIRDQLQASITATGAPLSTADALHRLGLPLRRSMQLRPAPELVWRIAAKPHLLGDTPIQAGDKVVVAIVSATQQELADGVDNVFPVFGGKRGPDPTDPDMPAHACPGYASAMGAMLGTICALLERTETMRPSPIPLSITFSGP